MRGSRLLIAAVTCALAAGCDDDGSALEGIYMVESATRNMQGCETEGQPYTFGNPIFFVKWEEFFGYGALNVRDCQTLEECRAEYAEDDTIHLGGPSLDDGDDSRGWTSESGSGFEFDGECRASISRDRLEKSGEDGVRIEEREFDVPNFPPTSDEDDPCPEKKVFEVGGDLPCTTLEVRVGRLIER